MKQRNLGTCVIEGCERRAYSRELCSGHYVRKSIGNDDLSPIGPRGRRPRFPGVDPRVAKIWSNVEFRCTYPGTNKYEYYGGRGIRNLLTPYDVQFLWDRDNAATMNVPSIDRKKSDLNYTLENCRFIEFAENRRWRERRHKKR